MTPVTRKGRQFMDYNNMELDPDKDYGKDDDSKKKKENSDGEGLQNAANQEVANEISKIMDELTSFATLSREPSSDEWADYTITILQAFELLIQNVHTVDGIREAYRFTFWKLVSRLANKMSNTGKNESWEEGYKICGAKMSLRSIDLLGGQETVLGNLSNIKFQSGDKELDGLLQEYYKFSKSDKNGENPDTSWDV